MTIRFKWTIRRQVFIKFLSSLPWTMMMTMMILAIMTTKSSTTTKWKCHGLVPKVATTRTTQRTLQNRISSWTTKSMTSSPISSSSFLLSKWTATAISRTTTTTRLFATPSTSTTTTTTTTTTTANRLQGLDNPTVWHEFSPMAQQYGSINLGQGFPDWNPPKFVLDAMNHAIYHGGPSVNQYARSYAHLPLAKVLAQDYSTTTNRIVNPETEIATATGVTNILYCALQGIINPGDEVILLEPAFDIYASQVQMAGGICVYCPLRPQLEKLVNDPMTSASDIFTLDLEELQSKITSKTKAIILNTPHNPTGKMFSLKELQGIAQIVLNHPTMIVISDEVYQHITFDDNKEPHLSIASVIPEMWDRTLTMSSAGKTFSCTGWKVGWAVGPSHLIKAITAVQQWVNFSSVTPTQDAIAQALLQAREPYTTTTMPSTTTTTETITYPNYYESLKADYKFKRQLLMTALQSANMTPIIPPGGFFIMADTSLIDFPYEEIASTQVTPAMPVMQVSANNSNNNNSKYTMPRDWALNRWLTQTVGVTAIPPSSFYSTPNIPLAQNLLRFAFCKSPTTIQQAQERLKLITKK